MNLGWKIVWALGQIGDTKAVDFFIVTLRDPSYYMREKAFEMLGKIGDVRAAEPLIAKLVSGEKVSVLGKYGLSGRENRKNAYDEAKMAAQALSKIRDIRAVKALIAVYNTVPYEIDYSYIEIVVRSLEDNLEAMAAEVEIEDLRTIAYFGDPSIEGYSEPGCGESSGHMWSRKTSCSHLRQLARQELIRRGLKA